MQSVGIFIALVVGYVVFQTLTMRRMKRIEGETMSGETGVPGMKSEGKKLVYFYTPTCHACKTMTPIIEGMMESRSDVYKVDASMNHNAARNFNIMATPTTLVLDGLKIEKVLVGLQKEKNLLEYLQN